MTRNRVIALGVLALLILLLEAIGLWHYVHNVATEGVELVGVWAIPMGTIFLLAAAATFWSRLRLKSLLGCCLLLLSSALLFTAYVLMVKW